MRQKIFVSSNFLLSALLTFSILNLVVFPTFAQSNSSQQTSGLSQQAKKIKKKIEKIGKGNNLTIVVKNGDEFYGSINSIENDFVYIAEVDKSQNIEIKYEEIKDVWKNYGTTKNRFGNRIRPRTKWIIMGAVVGGLVALSFWAASQLK